MSSIEIDLDRGGHGSVKVDGMDIAGATTGIHLDADVGSPVRMTLDLIGVQMKAKLGAEVEVHVNIGSWHAVGSSIPDALRNLITAIEGSPEAEERP